MIQLTQDFPTCLHIDQIRVSGNCTSGNLVMLGLGVLNFVKKEKKWSERPDKSAKSSTDEKQLKAPIAKLKMLLLLFAKEFLIRLYKGFKPKVLSEATGDLG